jgi:DNA helicase II / ATP-dependent DNA helicase PcrA
VIGGLRFYDRKEIKDVLAYLRAVANPADTVSLLRVVNTPKRGVGKSTLDGLTRAANELGVPLWEIISDETSVKTIAGRSAKGVLEFAKLIQTYRDRLDRTSAAEMVQGILEDSGYVTDLKSQNTDEAEDRVQNVQELYNAVLQFEEETEADNSLIDFLASAALASDLDDTDAEEKRVSLMTLHASKGLEFPVVFMVGLEQGLFPSYRSLDDPSAIEEERRLCYVGITRAQERLFICYARERRLYGNREPAQPSLFLSELPKELLETNTVSALPGKSARGTAAPAGRKGGKATSQFQPRNNPPQDWQMGDRVLHESFGLGQVTHVFSSASKVHLGIKFAQAGHKIIDPRLAPMRKVES